MATSVKIAAIFFSLQFALSWCDFGPGQLTLPPEPSNSRPTCARLTGKSLRECGNVYLNRNWTEFPNQRDHSTLTEAYAEFKDYLPILNCHPMRLLVCYFYFPLSPSCDPRFSQAGSLEQYDLLPCRSVCQTARTNCESYMMQNNLTWPSALNCSRFPEATTHPTCFPLPPSPATPTTSSPSTSPTTSSPTSQSSASTSSVTTSSPSTSSPTSRSPETPSPTPPNATCAPCDRCAKIRTSVSYKTVLQQDVSLIAKVKITTEKLSSDGTYFYDAKVLTNYTVNCNVPQLVVGQKISLYTDMTPCCKCARFTKTLVLGHVYLVGGHYGTDGKWRLKTAKSSGGCILSKWKSKYTVKLSGWLQRAKPVKCSA